MAKWTDWETQVITFFASFNKMTERKYEIRTLVDLWTTYYPSFPSRSYSAIAHKLKEVRTFDLKEDFIDFLLKSKKPVLNVNDVAAHYNIPPVVIDVLIDVFEKEVFNVKFYNKQTSSLNVPNAVSLVTNKTKVIHAQEFFKENAPESKEVIEEKEEPKKEVFTQQTFQLGNSDEEIKVAANDHFSENTDSAWSKIEEIQIELNNPTINRSRRKALKKALKKYKKQLGFVDEDKPVTEDIRSEAQKIKDTEVGYKLLEEVKKLENDAHMTREYMHFKIGVIADTHIGSKTFDPESLAYFYEVCEEEGIDRVIHAGDLFDGETTYVYQNLDQNLPSYKEQFNWILRNYPKHPGIYTYVISGNHDMNIYKKHNINPIQEISKVRPDIRYSGDYLTTFTKCGVVIDVVHCDGSGVAEPMNKLRTLIHGLDHDVDIYIMGHLHQSMELHSYGRVGYAVLPGCFVKPSTYTIRKGYNPTVGGYILDITKTGDKVEVTSRWVTKQ